MTVVINGTTGIASPGGDTSTSLATGALAVAGNNISAVNSLGFRNRIINGDMRISQAAAGAAVSASMSYAVDRFISIERSGYTTLAVTAQQQTSDVPANFSHALKLLVGTGQAVASSGNLNVIDQRIEGFNFADLGFGTVSAKPFTMSFWVKSSITGTYPVSFFNASVTRAYLATYTINSANTWEYKTFTVAGDTSGTWGAGNGIGLGFQMAVSAGSNNFGTPGSWGGTYKSGVSGMPDLGATTGATFFVTGVQIEAGTVATPFERRDYGRELMMCQRYFQKWNYSGALGSPGATALVANKYSTTDSLVANMSLNCPMRASPTLSSSNATARAVINTGPGTTVTITAISAGIPNADTNVAGAVTITCSNNSLAAGFGWLDQVGVVSASAEL
jgi:hypothetical protein